MSDQALSGSGVSGEGLPVEPIDPIMLAEVLEAMAGRLESLEGLVEAMTAQLVDSPAGGPWSWRHLGPSQTRALFTELRDWVDRLISRYELRGEAETIPPCWFLHPVAVEELTALMVAWRAAYSQKEIAPSDALVNWHDRWLWPTLHRLNLQLRVWAKCTGGSHAPSRPGPLVTDEASFTSFLVNAGARIDAAPYTGLEDALDRDAVESVLLSGEAVALLPGDPWSPIRYRDRWYAVPDGMSAGMPAELWRPVDEERQAQLGLMASRLSLTGHAGSGSA
ncbi:MAG: hypothetical protein ACYDDU_16555 [Dermatophilaceae bacterium]